MGYYLSPEDRFYPKQYKEQGYWTATNMNVHVVAYNTIPVARTDLFHEQEAIKNLELVPLDPSAGENMDYYAKQLNLFAGSM